MCVSPDVGIYGSEEYCKLVLFWKLKLWGFEEKDKHGNNPKLNGNLLLIQNLDTQSCEINAKNIKEALNLKQREKGDINENAKLDSWKFSKKTKW